MFWASCRDADVVSVFGIVVVVVACLWRRAPSGLSLPRSLLASKLRKARRKESITWSGRPDSLAGSPAGARAPPQKSQSRPCTLAHLRGPACTLAASPAPSPGERPRHRLLSEKVQRHGGSPLLPEPVVKARLPGRVGASVLHLKHRVVAPACATSSILTYLSSCSARSKLASHVQPSGSPRAQRLRAPTAVSRGPPVACGFRASFFIASQYCACRFLLRCTPSPPEPFCLAAPSSSSSPWSPRFRTRHAVDLP